MKVYVYGQYDEGGYCQSVMALCSKREKAGRRERERQIAMSYPRVREEGGKGGRARGGDRDGVSFCVCPPCQKVIESYYYMCVTVLPLIRCRLHPLRIWV